jgi:hypothetical protein
MPTVELAAFAELTTFVGRKPVAQPETIDNPETHNETPLRLKNALRVLASLIESHSGWSLLKTARR